ncbi:hypothetical protein TNCV_442251 [Trichonephila clavipes]|nr:hypothetical protein TNCV_442251 [Trichonephila clavipes]
MKFLVLVSAAFALPRSTVRRPLIDKTKYGRNESVVMWLNENYTFEGAADRCGQDLASVRCVFSLQNCPGTGFQSFRWGRKAIDDPHYAITTNLSQLKAWKSGNEDDCSSKGSE